NRGSHCILAPGKDEMDFGLPDQKQLADGQELGLELYQPVRRFGKNGECRELATYHGDFITSVKPGTDVAILVNLVGKILPPRHLESLARKKLRSAGEEADAIHPMPFRFGQQSLHEATAAA